MFTRSCQKRKTKGRKGQKEKGSKRLPIPAVPRTRVLDYYYIYLITLFLVNHFYAYIWSAREQHFRWPLPPRPPLPHTIISTTALVATSSPFTMTSTTTALQPPASAATTTSSVASAASSSGHTNDKAEGGEPGEAALKAPEISSPHQLIDWVDTVLGQLETRFDDMNGQVTARSKLYRFVMPRQRAELRT